jgi:hypothetical protein
MRNPLKYVLNGGEGVSRLWLKSSGAGHQSTRRRCRIRTPAASAARSADLTPCLADPRLMEEGGQPDSSRPSKPKGAAWYLDIQALTRRWGYKIPTLAFCCGNKSRRSRHSVASLHQSRAVLRWLTLRVPEPEETIKMKALVSILTLSLTLAWAATAFAATKPPHTKAACDKAHMTWDAATKKCSP